MPVQITRGHYGAHRFAGHLGLTRWQMRLGLEHGILPGPDLDGERWSAKLAEEVKGHGERVIARFGDDPPVGSARAAARLAARVGLDVERRDAEVLVAQGDLTVISSFRGHPVYLLGDLDRLDTGCVRSVVSARKGPLIDTVDSGGAATILNWPRRTFDRIAGERGLTTDRLGRYALADVHALRADETLVRQIADEQREMAVARTRRAEAKVEDAIRGWLRRCGAYVDRDADLPPDIAPLSRAIRALTSVRTEMTDHEKGPS
ncbi:hypothetical protein E1281_30195 [Actinomadura sp. KC345]|uniref:hypothetical protein n=1 Tax=Actinomadura sp. KC345 TaxID=2530371 RepID=UPI001047DE71|nr:hypothetical protein [Actinomadura sp. KC345]TDC45503.1 hypothetical protein E1281_30195 [Actinomadura sp. KC345]